MKKRDRINKKKAARSLRTIRLKHTRELTPGKRAYKKLCVPWFFGFGDTFQFEPRWRLIKRLEATK
jgi:hypothetical protein